MATKTKSAKAKAPKAKSAPKATTTKPAAKQSKREVIRSMLSRKQGATTQEICKAVGWAAISLPPIARALGLKLTVKTNDEGKPVYFAKG